MPKAQGDSAAQGSRLTDHPADAVSSPESGGEYVDGEFCEGEPGRGDPPDAKGFWEFEPPPPPLLPPG